MYKTFIFGQFRDSLIDVLFSIVTVKSIDSDFILFVNQILEIRDLCLYCNCLLDGGGDRQGNDTISIPKSGI